MICSVDPSHVAHPAAPTALVATSNENPPWPPYSRQLARAHHHHALPSLPPASHSTQWDRHLTRCRLVADSLQTRCRLTAPSSRLKSCFGNRQPSRSDYPASRCVCNLPRILTSPIAVTAQPSQPIGLIDTSWSNDTCLASTASENFLSSYQVHKSSAPESPYRTASWLCGCRCFPGSAESLMICVLLMRVLRTHHDLDYHSSETRRAG